MPRYFTLEQAQTHLLSLARELQSALAFKVDFEAAEGAIQENLKRITAMGGTLVDQDRFVTLKSKRDESLQMLKQAVGNLLSEGCLVKDLDIGLLDFPTLYRGQEVYLCWKVGEARIEYWHGVAEGFQGRKKIDQEFVDNHKGDPLN